MVQRLRLMGAIVVIALFYDAHAELAFTTRNSHAGGATLRAIAGGNGRLVAVGTAGRMLQSSDGLNWTVMPQITTDNLNGIVFAAGMFVTIGDAGRVLLSSDGNHWTVSALSDGLRLNAIGYGNSTFIAVGEAGRVFASTDGRTWERRTVSLSTELRAVSFDSTAGFVIGGDDASGRRSLDGVSWSGIGTSVFPPASFQAAAGNRALGEAVLLADTGSLYRVTVVSDLSATGTISSITRHSGSSARRPSARFHGVMASGGSILALGEGGLICSVVDSVNQPWPTVSSDCTANLFGGTAWGGAFYAVGENETILQSGPFVEGRLMNISTRGVVAGHDRLLISGIVVSGAAPKHVLIRAVGPSLAGFGVLSPLGLPQLALYDSAGTLLVTAGSWSSSPEAPQLREAASRVGAFPLGEGGADAAILRTLAPGNYTVQVSGSNATAGVALTEIYDLDSVVSATRAINISTRSYTASGDNIIIAGFNVGGDTSMRLLIRAVGPSLTRFGVTDAVIRPTMGITDGKSGFTFPGGTWSTLNTSEMRFAARSVGAFPLDEGSQDFAWIRVVPPGNWFVQVGGFSGAQGTALVEIYEMP